MLEAKLQHSLTKRFADHVMRAANLPLARRHDVEQAPSFSLEHGELRCTCGITGSTYATAWDGSEERAVALVEEAAAGTAFLLTKTPHYAWLRSSRGDIPDPS
jgi:hypothetical protein